jgi:hypothetical protein
MRTIRMDLRGVCEGFWVEFALDKQRIAALRRAIARDAHPSAIATVAIRSNLVDARGVVINVARGEDWLRVPIEVIAQINAFLKLRFGRRRHG